MSPKKKTQAGHVTHSWWIDTHGSNPSAPSYLDGSMSHAFNVQTQDQLSAAFGCGWQAPGHPRCLIPAIVAQWAKPEIVLPAQFTAAHHQVGSAQRRDAAALALDAKGHLC